MASKEFMAQCAKKEKERRKSMTYKHEIRNPDREKRMELNGESEEQMAHAMAIKYTGGVSLNPEDGNDTSKDQPWEYDTSTCGKLTDIYVELTTLAYLGIKLPLLAIPMLAVTFLPMCMARNYMMTFPDRTEYIPRTFTFWLVFDFTFVLSLPAIAFIYFNLFLDYVFYYLFGFIYVVCTWRWKAVGRSMSKISPYRNGPSILLHSADFFVCCMGQAARQNMGEPWFRVSVMFLLLPWLKYYINCNPLIYDLDHRMVQQISTTMQDLGEPEVVSDRARSIISQARQPRKTVERLGCWNFIPHYPDPPPDRRFSLGLQSGGGRYPGKFTLIVHTTHAKCEGKGANGEGNYNSSEQFVLSNSCALPIYRVMLWYSNPFHFLTGWVEASVSNGEPSQQIKCYGGEHPMWLVTSRTPLCSGRDSWTGSGMIDYFFDTWLPVFVWEMRLETHLHRLRQKNPDSHYDERIVIAEEEADKLYQQVESKDGVSTPIDDLVGRAKYEGQDTLSIYRDGRQFKQYGQRLANIVMGEGSESGTSQDQEHKGKDSVHESFSNNQDSKAYGTFNEKGTV